MTASTARPFLPYGRQAIDEDDIAAVADILRGDWLTTGPTVKQFEEAFAKRVGAAHAVSCSSGTAGLHISAMALGLGPGDRAIVPPVTFLATANALRYVGAEVVFSDVDPETGLMTADTLRSALARTEAGSVKAVLPVHLKGLAADPTGIAAVAREHGLKIIEDACHALGTTYRSDGASQTIGNCAHSTMSVFSFHPVKTIAMGEGGAVTTNDPVLYERMLRARAHGMDLNPQHWRNTSLAFEDGAPAPWYYEMPEPGYNYRATDINCALALSQLAKLDRFIARRSELTHLYDRLLTPLAPHVLPPRRMPDCDPGWHLYAVQIDFAALGMSRSQMMQALRAAGIGSQVHYIPVHMQPYYVDRYGEQQLPGAMQYYRRTLSLPLFPTMQDSDVERVVETLAGIVTEHL